MNSYLVAASVAAIVGGGVVTGLLFAFSNFVMRALADMPPEQGMFAMQRINERIINPIFLLFFLGTPIACVFVLIAGFGDWQTGGVRALMAGAMLHLVGPFGVTMVKNVPLNKRLAEHQPNEDGAVWHRYRKHWQFWNHIRSYIGIASVAAMAWGLASLNP